MFKGGDTAPLWVFVSLPCHTRWLPLRNLCAVGGGWEGASLASGYRPDRVRQNGLEKR